ncbi:MAG: tetratricopeptide repeat protein [Acidobacteria bacterium]|nr:tetratricopeptide repeat protein [Acidobacteriota bacterium]MBI3654855.1 tetratricopeptide repeat protein [Acidobacteriota bacterium]
MSDRRLILSRLRTSATGPAGRKPLGRLRYWTLAGALLLMLSVGWWAYSRTTDQDLFLKAGKLVRAARYTEALALYERIFYSSSQAELAEQALFDAANICYFNLGERRRAIELYNRLIASFPNGCHAPQACFHLAKIFASDMGDLPRAIRAWEDGLKVRPDSPVVLSTEQYLEALSNVADGYFSLNGFDEALAVYQRIADDYPGTHNANQSNLKIGIIFQTQGLYRTSLKPLKTAIKESQCDNCQFMAQTSLVEAYENLEELDEALQVVHAMAFLAGQEEYKQSELQRLQIKKRRLASGSKPTRGRRTRKRA